MLRQHKLFCFISRAYVRACEGVARLQVALESTKIRRDLSPPYSVQISLATRYSVV